MGAKRKPKGRQQGKGYIVILESKRKLKGREQGTGYSFLGAKRRLVVLETKTKAIWKRERLKLEGRERGEGYSSSEQR